MIPREAIDAWRAEAPWIRNHLVEQDLTISRALVAVFSHPLLSEALAFRGGTALYKLYLGPLRYSEDIDLVQIEAAPSGPVMGALREVLNPWLGKPRWKQSEGRVTFIYRFGSADTPPVRLRLKVEINTREHFSVFGLQRLPFEVRSNWFGGACDIRTYELDELLGTKMRALYQRRKVRDLFDLEAALDSGSADPGRIVQAFLEYMAYDGRRVARVDFADNLAAKMEDPAFTLDIGSLLADGRSWDPGTAAGKVGRGLVRRLPS